MRQHHGPISPLAVIRQLAQKFALLVLVAIAFGMMLIGKADTVLVEKISSAVSDVAAPILDVISRPAAGVADMVENVRGLAALRTENANLKLENERLLQWQTAARRLEEENKALKSLLHASLDGEVSYTVSRVIADAGGAFSRSLLINTGSKDGVTKGQAVVTGLGLAGRVTGVGRHSARILLLTDINSRIPVMAEASGAKAILAGDNTSRPKIIFTMSGTEIKPGDRIVTSGSAAAFPPGIPVGTAAADKDGTLRVDLFVERSTLEYVKTVEFNLPGIISTDEGGLMDQTGQEGRDR